MGRADGTVSSMRGRLCDVLLSALCEGEAESVMQRLGDRAGFDDPVFGGSRNEASGAHIVKLIDWMKERAARFEKSNTVIGTAIDVAEGVLFFGPQGARQRVPTAVVVERKREREVEVRLHFVPALWSSKVLGPTLSGDPIVSIGIGADSLAALTKGPHAPCFEQRARVRDGLGAERPVEGAVEGELFATSLADDSRALAMEVRGTRGAGVIVLERSLGGMIRAARIYGPI